MSGSADSMNDKNQYKEQLIDFNQNKINYKKRPFGLLKVFSEFF